MEKEKPDMRPRPRPRSMSMQMSDYLAEMRRLEAEVSQQRAVVLRFFRNPTPNVPGLDQADPLPPTGNIEEAVCTLDTKWLELSRALNDQKNAVVKAAYIDKLPFSRKDQTPFENAMELLIIFLLAAATVAMVAAVLIIAYPHLQPLIFKGWCKQLS